MRGNQLLQTLLSGVAGGTRGYVAQRNRQAADEERRLDRDRSDLYTMLTLMDRDGTEMARAGQNVESSIPSAVPMGGVGADAMRAADQQAGPRSGDTGMGRFTVAGRDFALPSAAMRRTNARADALETARAQARMQADMQDEAQQKQNLGYYNALGIVGLPRGKTFDPTIPYEALLDYRRALAGRSGAGSGGGSGAGYTLDDINQQVARYVDAIARTGNETVEFGQRNTRPFTEAELIQKGNEMRRILLSLYGSPVPSVDTSRPSDRFGFSLFGGGQRPAALGGGGTAGAGAGGAPAGAGARPAGARPAGAAGANGAVGFNPSTFVSEGPGADLAPPLMEPQEAGNGIFQRRLKTQLGLVSGDTDQPVEEEGNVSPFRQNLRDWAAEWRRLSGSEAPMPRGINLNRYATDPSYKQYINGLLRERGYDIGDSAP